MARTWQTRPLRRAIAAVAGYYGMQPAQLVNNRTRTRTLACKRQLVMWLAIKTGSGYSQTGRYMGFDHTTVMHGVRVVERRRAEDEVFRERSDALLDVALNNNRVEYPVCAVVPPGERPPIATHDRRKWDDDLVRSFGL